MKKHGKGHKVIHYITIICAFVVLHFIKPIMKFKEKKEIIKCLPKLLVSKTGIVEVDDKHFLTWKSGAPIMEKLLVQKGYNVSTLFRECTFWNDSTEPKVARGIGVGEYIILWHIND
ncbi:MAG: hypothetical protein ACRCSG_04980 [Cellulosilyticaceae bacterium]